MGFVYLSIGILLVFFLHTVLKWFAHAQPSQVRKASGWVFIILIIAVIFMLVRAGLPHLAAIASFLGIVIPLLQKFQANKGAKSSDKRVYQKGRMTAEEARDILGVAADASPKDIHTAHRRMIQKNHPDQGGSEYLASKINEARDVLLKK